MYFRSAEPKDEVLLVEFGYWIIGRSVVAMVNGKTILKRH